MAAWRYKWVVVAVTLFVVIAAIAYSYVRPEEPQFSAASTIVIQEPITTEGVEQQGIGATYIRSQLEILNSPVVAEAARQIVLDSGSDLADPLQESPEVTIVGSPDSPLVTANVIAATPELAIALSNAVAEAYREVSRRQATSTSTAQLTLIDAQVSAIDDRLSEIEHEESELVSGNEELARLQLQAQEAVGEIGRLQASLTSGDLPEEAAESIRQQIDDYRQVMVVYQEVLEATASNPERRALEEEQTRQVTRRASLLTLRDQIAVGVGLAPDSIALVQPALDAVELPSVDIARVLGAAVLVGLAGGLGIAYFLHSSRRAVAGRHEPGPIFGATLLADIPDFAHEGISSNVPVRDNPRSAAAESFRFASSTLEVAARAHSATVVFVASSTHARGKTSTAVNTAIAAAAENRSVLVLDCDFGNQQATTLLLGSDTGPMAGITDVIEGNVTAKEATHEVRLPSGGVLHLMPRGGGPSLAATTLQSKNAREMIRLLSTIYDLILIDGPPMLQVAYASVLAGLADGILVVVEHGSPHSELSELKSRLDLVGTPVLGYVYNKSPLRREMTVTEGSMKDTLGSARAPEGAAVRGLRGVD